MNLNQRIEELRGDGIPGYNAKINQMIRTINWLMGVRVTNGRPVRESDSGPVFDLSPATAQGGPQPWLTDPNGNPATWEYLTALDLDGKVTGTPNNLYQAWAWMGNEVYNIKPVPWMTDPNGAPAGWVQHDVCVNGTVVQKWFWGTP
jgi:hypothetical protein